MFLNPVKSNSHYRPGHLEKTYIPALIKKGLIDSDRKPNLEKIYGAYRKVGDLTKELNPKTPVVDVGCGIGLSMLAMNYLGIDTIVIEITQEFIEQAQRFGLKVSNQDIYQYRSQKYEIATLSSVIEHIEYPVSFLSAIRQNLLLSGGKLVITAPNIGSIDFIVKKGGESTILMAGIAGTLVMKL